MRFKCDECGWDTDNNGLTGELANEEHAQTYHDLYNERCLGDVYEV